MATSQISIIGISDTPDDAKTLAVCFFIHVRVATDNARISSTTFRFQLYSRANSTNFENRYVREERAIVIPEVARFSRHLICNVFNSRFPHGLVRKHTATHLPDV